MDVRPISPVLRSSGDQVEDVWEETVHNGVGSG
jgi:hypothetical protein